VKRISSFQNLKFQRLKLEEERSAGIASPLTALGAGCG